MNNLSYLPSALRGDHSYLSEQARHEIRNLSGAKPLAFLLQALEAWAVILGIVFMAIYVHSIWVTFLAILLIGTRLNILGLLVHEQAHSLGLRGKYGDVIANILAAYPIGITVEDYARVHLSHHKYFLTENDPDFQRKRGLNWKFPMPKRNLLKLFLSDLSGFSFIKLLKSKQLENKNIYNRLHPSPNWLRPAFYATIVGLLIIADTWTYFLIYWIIPLVFILPAVIRIGAICEHTYNLPPGASVIQSTPIIFLKWWEKLLIPDLNFKLHPYHHFFPGIAFCNLPKVHKIFQREKIVDEEAVFQGLFKFLRYLQSNRRTYRDAENISNFLK